MYLIENPLGDKVNNSAEGLPHYLNQTSHLLNPAIVEFSNNHSNLAA